LQVEDEGEVAGGAGAARSGLAAAGFNILKSYVGTGVISMPFAYSRGGLLLTPLGILLVSLASNYSVPSRPLHSHAFPAVLRQGSPASPVAKARVGRDGTGAGRSTR
jgi:hypothetical protein